MIEYEIYDENDVAESLNGVLVPAISRGSLKAGSEMIGFEQKIVEKTFLSGATLVGNSRLMSREMIFVQDFVFTEDDTFDSYFNNIIQKWRGAVKLRDKTNQKETDIALMNLEIPYDNGAFKRSGSFRVKIKMLNAYWTAVNPVTSSHALTTGINNIPITNSGNLVTYPSFVFDVPNPADQLDIYIDETKEGLQLVDDTLGTPTLTELLIDCALGTLTIGGFDRTQNITDRTGYFPFQIGDNTLVIDIPVDADVDIEFYERYYV